MADRYDPPDSPHSVGLVQTQSVRLFPVDAPLPLGSGGTFGPVDVAYELYGTPKADGSNVIYVCHAMTGDAHAAGWHAAEDRKPGWWDDFIGPGKAFNTDRYAVLCANVLGGCRGTTGPADADPETGRPYGPDFPFVTIADIVCVHRALCEHLGFDRVMAVVGGSLGGMQTLEWAARFPGTSRSFVVMASGPTLQAQGIAFNAVARRAIFADPRFKDGHYYTSPDGGTPEKPDFGLALARMIAHITYLSEESIEKKFGRRRQDAGGASFDLRKETEFQIESYLHYQGRQFVDRFDANSYLNLTRAMDYFDLAASHGPLHECLAAADARFLILSYTTDWLFPSSQGREVTTALLRAGRDVTFADLDSPFGHDAFLIEKQQLTDILRPFLRTV